MTATTTETTTATQQQQQHQKNDDNNNNNNKKKKESNRKNTLDLHGVVNRSRRGMTDQLVLSDIYSIDKGEKTSIITTITKEDLVFEKLEVSLSDTRQARLIDAVLFISLGLSGTLFFGAMNEYEIEKKNNNYQL